MNTGIFYITNNGFEIAQQLKKLYSDALILRFNAEAVSEIWDECQSIIFIMAAGIVVRTIAPLFKNKQIDPAIIVLSEDGRFAISLLSGHIGRANKITKEIADFLNADPVITTASDIHNLPSIDLWAKENGLVIDNWDALPEIGTKFVNCGFLQIYLDTKYPISLPHTLLEVSDPQDADVMITNKIHKPQVLYLRPKNLVVGIGCNSNISRDEIEYAVKKTLKENGLSFLSVCTIATIDRKANESGLVEFTKRHGFEMKTWTADELNSVSNVEQSKTVFEATGAYSVSEPAALLAAGNNNLLVSKQRLGNVTVAVAENMSVSSEPKQKGKIYIIGTGPGNIEHITPYAQKAIKKSDVIIGYDTYLDLIKDLIKSKQVFSTGMTKEIERCKKAVQIASKGETVAMISSGDAGIYGMAGLVFEILKRQDKDKSTDFVANLPLAFSVEVIPGISALSACASRLGAPLMHDFASISLSDRLTSWEKIEKRLEVAAITDFVIVLYNPKSKGRAEHINKARDIILRYKPLETPVGIVRSAMRKDEEIIVTNLKDMLNFKIDMQTTIIIGNSKSFIWHKWMITPRGYKLK